ncbi:MAG: hypothetical protein JNL81_10310 [Hyphomonadaceae bacterium]|nr:hypothetical protein [Hyphomonadaceae bacterium]
MFNNSEYRFGAFAGVIALVLVLALTAMAFTALEPDEHVSQSWEISAPQPFAGVMPGFAN